MPHSVETMDTIAAPSQIGPKQNLGVGLRNESVAVLLEIVTQFEIIINLPIEGDDDAGFIVDHGLVARGRQIDN